MAHVNRRIGKSSETAGSTADGTGGGVLDAFIYDYFQRSGNVFNAPGVAPAGLTATGGVISDYTTGPGDVYRAHIFTSSGTFDVTALGNAGNTVEYLVVAGGGGGLGFFEQLVRRVATLQLLDVYCRARLLLEPYRLR